jgi:hypothetical protein
MKATNYQKVIERTVYIKSTEDMEKAKREASNRTEAIFALLKDGLSFGEVSKRIGVPVNFVKNLSALAGYGTTKVFDPKQWRSINAGGLIQINAKKLGLPTNLMWRITDIAENDGKFTVELKQAN